jgi:hypothetical protein
MNVGICKELRHLNANYSYIMAVICTKNMGKTRSTTSLVGHGCSAMNPDLGRMPPPAGGGDYSGEGGGKRARKRPRKSVRRSKKLKRHGKLDLHNVNHLDVLFHVRVRQIQLSI